jgi:deferrochelatase/peroxidase EfeB
VLIMAYAAPDELDEWETTIRGSTWLVAFQPLYCMSTTDLGGIEPFGFADGISQPRLDWKQRTPARLCDTTAYTNVSALGEFLLGYRNEYGRYTDRPLLDPVDDPDDILPPAENAPGKKDLGRNGSYLVVRDLSQDVPGFWRSVNALAKRDAHERRRLAAAMVGRMPAEIPIVRSSEDAASPIRLRGEPIVQSTNTPIDGVGPDSKDIRLNQFTFHGDPDGVACPYGAHIRRANPRNADLPEGTSGLMARLIRLVGFGRKSPRDDLLASTRFHRILRRGREYGPGLTPEQAIEEGAAGADRGLRFFCLNGSIARQFEFIQTSWIANSKFDGLDESDPLLGNRARSWPDSFTDTFTRPRDSGFSCQIPGLPQFVTVRGGAYFFMPGKRALRYLARGRSDGGTT